MSRRGAVDARLTEAAAAAPTSGQDRPGFLPDFCQARTVLAVVLIAELLAVVFALVRGGDLPFWPDLGRVSLFVQWLGLTSAALLCIARRRLERLSPAAVSAAVFALLVANTAVLSALAVWLGARPLPGIAPALAAGGFPPGGSAFVLRNAGIAAIVTALLLRYCFVTHEWRRQVRAQARSRIDALQARMRPHFLFNSMNTIAALTRSEPRAAEQAVEDLADLLRATLRESARPLTVAEELDLTRLYQRIEALRLGDRLHVVWDVDALPADAAMPGLTLQPLLENAIYHGIEPLDAGGTVTITGRTEGGRLVVTLENPLVPGADERPGNRQALDNLRERLRLAYGDRGKLLTRFGGGRFAVTVELPLETPGEAASADAPRAGAFT